MAEKILIVDDDLDTLRMVGLMLERQGYKIVAASGGRQALTLTGSENPDLILLDIMMPDLDGLEVARQLRSSPDTRDIPIIMFTAKTQLENKLDGYEAGADAYLTKPTQPRELIAQVKAVLGRTKKGRSAAPIGRERGRLVGVIGAKGGIGVTTVTLNTALAVQMRHKKSVLAADFRPGCGSLGLELGYFDAQGLNRLLEVPANQITPEAIEATLVTHSSQVRLLLSSPYPYDARYSNAVENFVAIAEELPYLADYSLVDLGVGLTPVNEKVVGFFDLLIFILEPVASTLAQTRTMREYLVGRGISEDNMLHVLVNRIRTGMQLPLSQVQDQYGRGIPIVFAPTPDLAYEASKNHTPIVLMQAESVPTQQFYNLADKIIGRDRIVK